MTVPRMIPRSVSRFAEHHPCAVDVEPPAPVDRGPPPVHPERHARRIGAEGCGPDTRLGAVLQVAGRTAVRQCRNGKPPHGEAGYRPRQIAAAEKAQVGGVGGGMEHGQVGIRRGRRARSADRQPPRCRRRRGLAGKDKAGWLSQAQLNPGQCGRIDRQAAPDRNRPVQAHSVRNEGGHAGAGRQTVRP